MDGQSVFRIFGYSTSVIVFGAGIAILTGFLLPEGIPSNMRILAGVVLILYGVYRASMLWVRARASRRSRDEVL